MKIIKKIVDINPQDPLAHYNLGNTYAQLADFSKAEESYKKAISLKPNFPEAHYNLGTIFEKNQKWKKSLLSALVTAVYNQRI